jgi:small GTP-binding protein
VIGLFGKGVVGKFCLIKRFLTGIFPTLTEPEIELRFRAEIDIPKQGKKTFEILDTAGNEDYDSLFKTWIQETDGFLLVFAINNKESFQFIKNRYKTIKELDKDKNPIIIVGNKCDLESERKIDSQEAIEYAKEIGSKYYETSAKTDANGNCKIIFEECANMIYTPMSQNNSKKCIIF